MSTLFSPPPALSNKNTTFLHYPRAAILLFAMRHSFTLWQSFQTVEMMMMHALPAVEPTMEKKPLTKHVLYRRITTLDVTHWYVLLLKALLHNARKYS